MYKIVPAEQQECSNEMITKNRCKPSKNGLQRSFLAPPAGFEPVACRLGGDRSIQLSYGGLYRKYSLLQDSRIRTIRFLGGGRSIQLSYWCIRLYILPKFFLPVKKIRHFFCFEKHILSGSVFGRHCARADCRPGRKVKPCTAVTTPTPIWTI